MTAYNYQYTNDANDYFFSLLKPKQKNIRRLIRTKHQCLLRATASSSESCDLWVSHYQWSSHCKCLANVRLCRSHRWSANSLSQTHPFCWCFLFFNFQLNFEQLKSVLRIDHSPSVVAPSSRDIWAYWTRTRQDAYSRARQPCPNQLSSPYFRSFFVSFIQTCHIN